MKHLLLLTSLILLAAAAPGEAHAKGPALFGTYVGSAVTDVGVAGTLTLRFVPANTPGTTTRVMSCEIEFSGEKSPCTLPGYEPSLFSQPCPGPGKRSCAYDRNIVLTSVVMESTDELGGYDWKSSYSAFMPEGYLAPLFTLRTPSADATPATVVVEIFNKAFTLRRQSR